MGSLCQRICRGPSRGTFAAKRCSGFVVDFNNYGITGDDFMSLTPLLLRAQQLLASPRGGIVSGQGVWLWSLGWVIQHENQNINMERLTFMRNGIRKWVITFFFLYENFSLSPLALENRKNVLFYEKNQYNAYKLKFIK